MSFKFAMAVFGFNHPIIQLLTLQKVLLSSVVLIRIRISMYIPPSSLRVFAFQAVNTGTCCLLGSHSFERLGAEFHTIGGASPDTTPNSALQSKGAG